MDILELIGRKHKIFSQDITYAEADLSAIISQSSFLIIGGAGSIGQAVSKEIIKRSPKKIHIVDISENNLVEFVRDIRSSFANITQNFKTFVLDVNSTAYDAFIDSDGEYDYVLNLSAMKHVRSEKDPFTLMRMIDTNILNTNKILEQSIHLGVKKYFCVSTDKATNPVNMMGASKRIMEKFLMYHAPKINIATARFANVAFSDGSLLYGFNWRMEKQQPIVAPDDIKRYFLTPQESGELCLLSCIFGNNCDIFFPKLSKYLHLISFADIAIRYLENKGYEPYLCQNEEEARMLAKTLPSQKKWPCLFTASSTTGEKDFEEFFTQSEILDMNQYLDIGVIKNSCTEIDTQALASFTSAIATMKKQLVWEKVEIVTLFQNTLAKFTYVDKGKYLDSKM